MTATEERQFRTRCTIDSQGRVRAYYDYDAWEHLRRSDERQVRVKDLPRNFTIYENLDDFDV